MARGWGGYPPTLKPMAKLHTIPDNCKPRPHFLFNLYCLKGLKVRCIRGVVATRVRLRRRNGLKIIKNELCALSLDFYGLKGLKERWARWLRKARFARKFYKLYSN